MPPKDTIIVEKVPLDRPWIDHPQSFARMEQLYLELIENKVKIKQNLVNKDYEPPTNLGPSPTSIGNAFISPSTSESGSIKAPPAIEKYTPDSIPRSETSSVSERLEKLDRQIGSDSEPDSPRRLDTQSEHDPRDFRDFKGPIDSDELQSIRSDRQPGGNANLSNKLQDLLARRGNEPHAHSVAPVDSRFEDYQRSRKRLPTLSELEKQGATASRRELADASRLQIDDEDLKREMLFKFDLLRKSYKENNIPTFTIHSDLGMMTRSYEDTVRRLSLDSSVETYKRYLIGAFMLIEFALGKWLKFDMKGYTQQQIVSMSSYEKLLIEIGEKSYIPGGEQWSVEVRLVFLVIINTAFFLVGKMIMNNTGANLMNAINNMNRANTEQPTKKKMQGPNINLDDLPDVNDIH